MTDEIDRAAARTDELLADALAAQRRHAAKSKGLVSALECECGDEIPEARRQAVPGVQRCVFCQEVFERLRGAR